MYQYQTGSNGQEAVLFNGFNGGASRQMRRVEVKVPIWINLRGLIARGQQSDIGNILGRILVPRAALWVPQLSLRGFGPVCGGERGLGANPLLWALKHCCFRRFHKYCYWLKVWFFTFTLAVSCGTPMAFSAVRNTAAAIVAEDKSGCRWRVRRESRWRVLLVTVGFFVLWSSTRGGFCSIEVRRRHVLLRRSSLLL